MNENFKVECAPNPKGQLVLSTTQNGLLWQSIDILNTETEIPKIIEALLPFNKGKITKPDKEEIMELFPVCNIECCHRTWKDNKLRDGQPVYICISPIGPTPGVECTEDYCPARYKDKE